MKSCKLRTFIFVRPSRSPTRCRIFLRPSGWLHNRVKATDCWAEVAIAANARSKALYHIAMTVDRSDRESWARTGQVYEVAITAPKSAL